YLVASRRAARQAPEIFNGWVFSVLLLGHVGNLALQLLAAGGAFSGHGMGVYTFGLLWFLFHAAVQFARIVFVQPGRSRQPTSPGVDGPAPPVDPTEPRSTVRQESVGVLTD
ncbi:MAG TPA: hypothetical protein VLT59_08260, partial [Steroidobacteraceae bacterium]|nr:hypothetical protein [Steroidobacteraceae bacterium]